MALFEVTFRIDMNKHEKWYTIWYVLSSKTRLSLHVRYSCANEVFAKRMRRFITISRVPASQGE